MRRVHVEAEEAPGAATEADTEEVGRVVGALEVCKAAEVMVAEAKVEAMEVVAVAKAATAAGRVERVAMGAMME